MPNKKTKDFFNKKTVKTIWILYALFSVILVMYLVDHLLTSGLDASTDQLALNDSWTITIQDEVYQDVCLDSFSFDSADKGTRITMTKTLPNKWSFDEPALCFHIRQSIVHMYIDGEEIYEYGSERAALGKTVGSGVQLIDFSNKYKGKELTIVLDVTENHAFSSFDPVWISEWNDSYRFIITENRLPFFLGAFLVVFGVAVTLIFIFAVALSRKYTSVLCLAIFSICIGLWTLSYHNILLIFSIPLYSVTLIEYMSLLLAPLPIIGYMYNYVKQMNSKPLMITYKVLFVTQLLLTVVTIFLHTKDIIHSAALLVYYHILLTIHCFFFAYVLYRGTKLNRHRKRIYSIGIIVVIGSIFYELLDYIFNRYIGFQFVDIKGVSSLGIIIFIAILVLDLYQDVTQKMMEEQEKALLIKRAYTDDLTQINNCGFCSEYMSKLQSEEDTEYTIISLDLNNLKKTNDTFGHSQGDLLIKEAASIINQAFSTSGVVGRMGGDEFIAILKTNDTAQIESLICALKKLIDDTNESKPDLNLSISYGYATGGEISEHNIEKVYQLADNRMYEYKRKSKILEA